MVLAPAFMHVLGRRNWWAPAPLVRLHKLLGLNDGHSVAIPEQGLDASPTHQQFNAELTNGFGVEPNYATTTS
jgi:RND superfamily putative drug exporter